MTVRLGYLREGRLHERPVRGQEVRDLCALWGLLRRRKHPLRGLGYMREQRPVWLGPDLRRQFMLRRQCLHRRNVLRW